MSARDLDRDLVAQLLRQPQGYDLFQAISLLERDAIADGHAPIGDSSGPEAVRLSSHVSLGFEASDVKGVRRGAAASQSARLDP